jgi:carboxymethylenebutenolidase
MDQRIINLYDEYTQKPLSRQELLKQLTQLTGSTVAAVSLLPLPSAPKIIIYLFN